MPANLLAALDSFLYDLYGTANAPSSGSSVSGRKFYKSIILPAIESADFRKRLLAEPEAVLKEKEIRQHGEYRIQRYPQMRGNLHARRVFGLLFPCHACPC